jgi:hypothetical protein
MSDELWIVINRWDDFQHYKDREPKWIKLYTQLHHDSNWLELSGHQRAVLVGLWLEYASAHAQLRLDTRSLSRRLGLRVSSATLEALNHAGFIRFSASTPLASRAPARSREGERENKGKVKDTLSQSQERVLGDFRRTPSRARGTDENPLSNEEAWSSPTSR